MGPFTFKFAEIDLHTYAIGDRLLQCRPQLVNTSNRLATNNNKDNRANNKQGASQPEPPVQSL